MLALANEHQNHDNPHIRQHDQELVGEGREAVGLNSQLQRLRQGEQQRAAQHAHRAPAAEVHQRDGDEAAAANQRIGEDLRIAHGQIRAGKRGHRATKRQRLISGLAHVNAHGVRRAGEGAAGTNLEAPRGLEEDVVHNRHHQEREVDHRVAAKEHLAHDRQIAQDRDTDGIDACNALRAADEMAIQGTGEARAEELQTDAGDALRRAELDDNDAEEQAEQRAHDSGGRQACDVHIPGDGIRAADQIRNEHAHECAHAHDALAAEVEDAAALVDRLAQRRQQQRAGKRNADREEQDDEVKHFRRPPFP